MGSVSLLHGGTYEGNQPAVDLVDGGGVTWSVTNDEADNKMSVGATVAASSPMIARLYYGPALAVSLAVGGSGLGAGALDTTNLTIPFTVPASGRIFIEATFMAEFQATNNPELLFAW